MKFTRFGSWSNERKLFSIKPEGYISSARTAVAPYLRPAAGYRRSVEIPPDSRIGRLGQFAEAIELLAGAGNDGIEEIDNDPCPSKGSTHVAPDGAGVQYRRSALELVIFAVQREEAEADVRSWGRLNINTR